MKRVLLPVLLVGAVLFAGGYYWFFSTSANVLERSEVELDPLMEAATVAIKGISLVQGEKGIEFWRLKAEWAAVHQEGDVIDVREPKVRYTMGEEGSTDYVHVVSDLGQITEQQSALRMWGSVKLTRDADVLTGPEMTYRTDERIAHFLQGGTIVRPTMEGTFGAIHWNMDEKRIDADSGVEVIFYAQTPQPQEVETQDGSAATHEEE